MTASSRDRLKRRGLRLEYLTVGWNVVEGLVSIGAALASSSVALLGFGVDSFVEAVSGVLLIWRLRAEHRDELDEEAIGASSSEPSASLRSRFCCSAPTSWPTRPGRS